MQDPAGNHLVDEELEVVITERLRRSDDLMKVCIHQVLDNVQILKVLLRRSHKLPQADHIIMLQVAEQHAFSQGASAYTRLQGMPSVVTQHIKEHVGRGLAFPHFPVRLLPIALLAAPF